ncbi:hypothetical protein FPQ18DRAFT_133864 [Pyronema domesticum]|nr:hypothetical protein FPQ18DRAFT_133864 [Pyronema domesticum]
MPSTALLRIPRADDKDSCILVHATNTSSTQLLELTLTATEGERAFETKLKESELGLYKRKQFSRSLDDLRSIIQYVFQKTPSTDPALVEGLDIKADVEDDIITIRIGKHYSGISQQFAVFGIPQKDSAEISIFDWAADSCKALDEVNETHLLLQSSLAAKDATIKSLTNQLSELTDLKKKHEDLLLVKFSELLNSKKAKIRELTRELERSSLGRSEGIHLPGPSPPYYLASYRY